MTQRERPQSLLAASNPLMLPPTSPAPVPAPAVQAEAPATDGGVRKKAEGKPRTPKPARTSTEVESDGSRTNPKLLQYFKEHRRAYYLQGSTLDALAKAKQERLKATGNEISNSAFVEAVILIGLKHLDELPPAE